MIQTNHRTIGSPRLVMVALLLTAGSLLAQTPGPLDVNALRNAAESGDVRAQVILGKAYLLGEKVEADDEQGVFWLRQAARNGDRVGQAWFGWAYEQGRGVRKDSQRAFSWYSRSARQGYEWAQQQRNRLKGGDEAMANVIRQQEQEQPIVTHRDTGSEARQFTAGDPVHGNGVGQPAIGTLSVGNDNMPDPRSDADARLSPELIAEQLRDWVTAELKSEIPDKVESDRLAIVTLELPTPPWLEQWQAAGVGIRVQADLQVDGTVVDPLTKPEQALRPHHGSKWRWEVQALESGVPLLDLSLRGRVLVPDHEPYRMELMRLGPRVAVEPSWSKRIQTLIRENQTAIGLTVLVPLFLWLGMSFAGRRGNRS